MLNLFQHLKGQIPKQVRNDTLKQYKFEKLPTAKLFLLPN